MFSNACEYGIKAVIYIAARSKENQLSNVTEISDTINSPKSFTAKVLQKLVKASIIKSVKGAQGGFFIDARKLNSLSVLHIVVAIDGGGIINNCVLGLRHCNEVNPCPMHSKFKIVKLNITNMLQTSLVAKLSDEMVKKLFVLKN